MALDQSVTALATRLRILAYLISGAVRLKSVSACIVFHLASATHPSQLSRRRDLCALLFLAYAQRCLFLVYCFFHRFFVLNFTEVDLSTHLTIDRRIKSANGAKIK